jgi:predicted esterase YcpF (UPF0227 family)
VSVARRLIYLHGFRSSARSFKARLLHERLQALGLGDRFVAPDLPPSPGEAMALVERDIRPGADDLLVGSSLGGCYATAVAERCGARAVLLNPAVRPARDLAGFVGEQRGYHDDLPFTFHRHYLDELRPIESVPLTRPGRYLLIAAKGDELLDWREMIARYPGAHHRVLEGSDHGLSDFALYQDEVLAFGGLLPPPGPAGA